MLTAAPSAAAQSRAPDKVEEVSEALIRLKPPTMTAQRWHEVRRLFHLCIEKDAQERDRLLQVECANDSQLKSEVESLLTQADRDSTFLEHLTLDQELTGAATAAHESWRGRRLGAYEIVGLLGEGGMGAVFRATRADGQFQQEVAIKLIRRGLEGEFALARFRAERQILASFDHPNVARLLDGGVTDEGLPYFVMELIEGEPIDRYCERNKLPIKARLELFCQVCAAVQYAHQRLTVHRDLKPGNILVTSQGVPKLLDFGIAKVLDPAVSESASVTLLQAMTPEYSSPEQLKGGAITTASDVYSLGVILYRLLTGQSPYRAGTTEPFALAKEVCETEPIRPSASLPEATTFTSRKELQGDLDSIVLMALRKEPNRRYASAEQFAEDIRRYFDNRPVAARQSTWGYRASRFLVRNKVAAFAGAAVALVLLTGVIATLWEAHIAAAERDRAERHFKSVRQLANSFMFEIHDEIAKVPGSTTARALLVKKALTYLDLLAKEPEHDEALQFELAEAYLRVGDVQGESGFSNLGDYAGALRSYRKATALLEQVLGPAPISSEHSLQLVRAYYATAGVLKALGQLSEELQVLTKGIDLTERLLQRDPENAEYWSKLGSGLHKRCQFHAVRGELVEAQSDAERSVQSTEKALALLPTDDKLKFNLSVNLQELAGVLMRSKDPQKYEQGIELTRRAVALLKEVVAVKPDEVVYRRVYGIVAGYLGAQLAEAGRVRDALVYLEEAAPLMRGLHDADPANFRASQDLAVVDVNMGNTLVESGAADKALPHLREALDLFGPAPEPPESNVEVTRFLMIARKDLAKAYSAAAGAPGQIPARRAQYWREAQRWATGSVALGEAVIAKKPEFAAEFKDPIGEAKAVLARLPR